jgi:hypothetical protein
MGRGKKKKLVRADPRIGPTPEQAANNNFASAGMAHRRIPVIDTMLERGQLTDNEHRRLSHYRDQAQMAERSPIKSCLNDSRTGGDHQGLGAAVVSAMLATGRIERELGSLLDIARAVAVDDVSLSAWCVAKHGGRERYNAAGEFVAVVPVAEKRVMEVARVELRMAARRIVA